MDYELQRLAEAVKIDLDLLPRYVSLYSKIHGIKPDIGPFLTATCQIHPYCNYHRSEGENHQWKFHPTLHMETDLLASMKIPENFFHLKKSSFPDPISSDQLLQVFYQGISHYFGIELCWPGIEEFFEKKLINIIPIIAELKIPPEIPDYPLVPISLEEAVELVNLRIDLIRNDIPFTGTICRNSLSFCYENFSPITIFGFSGLGGLEQYQRTRNSYDLYRINFNCGITIDMHNKGIAEAEFSIFG